MISTFVVYNTRPVKNVLAANREKTFCLTVNLYSRYKESTLAQPEQRNAMGTSIDTFFRTRKAGSTVRTEIIAGITAFMTMAYIIFVTGYFLP
jgi:hypothetical protein